MDDDSRLSLILFIALLGLAAFFAIAETALSSVSKSKIKVAAERGDNRAVKAVFILDEFDRAITTLLICTNIVHISAATIVTVAVTRMWGLNAVSLSTIITTIIIFFAGEMLPKSIAKKHSYSLTLATAGPVRLCMFIFKPLAMLLARIGRAVASAAGSEAEVTFTEEELVDLIEDMEEEGTIDEDQSDLLQATMDFSDTWVKHVMTPMDKVAALDADGDPALLHRRIVTSNHSRIPVYEDEKTNIIGVVQIRKYMRGYLGMQPENAASQHTDSAAFKTAENAAPQHKDSVAFTIAENAAPQHKDSVAFTIAENAAPQHKDSAAFTIAENAAPRHKDSAAFKTADGAASRQPDNINDELWGRITEACAPTGHKYPSIREIMDDVYYVNRNTPINDVLEKMSHRKLNMAVIQGTDMKARGVVTIEDILEELVGDIYDESDVIPKRKKGGAK